MGLSKEHREFRYAGVSHLEFKQVEMDRALTGFLSRLHWGGLASRRLVDRNYTVQTFADELLDRPDLFEGFDSEVTYRWAETHLLDLVNRGKPHQALAGPRPLHGFTYLFRVARHSRPYGADEQLYWMMDGAPGGKQVLGWLKRYFFTGLAQGANTPSVSSEEKIDVETQALINLWRSAGNDIEDRGVKEADHRIYPPFDPDSAALLVEDVGSLLYHGESMPRSVMVDHLKILFAFHLARYHLLLLSSVPAAVAGETVTPGRFFLDVEGAPGKAARLAERSAKTWYDRIPDFVRAVFELRKLEEYTRLPAGRKRLRRKPGQGSRPGSC
ncbi:hypothetical protein GCM10029992_07820 [Glycomyces albus]